VSVQKKEKETEVVVSVKWLHCHPAKWDVDESGFGTKKTIRGNRKKLILEDFNNAQFFFFSKKWTWY